MSPHVARGRCFPRSAAAVNWAKAACSLGALACGSLTDPVSQVHEYAACPAALFCDDFESFEAGKLPSGAWSPFQLNGTVRVDDSRAYRSALSVKATTLATSEAYKVAVIGLIGAPVVPVPDEAFYGRMMFYLESAPSTLVHWTFIAASGVVPGRAYSAEYRYGGELLVEGGEAGGSLLKAGYDTTDFYQTPPVGPHTDCHKDGASAVLPVGRWACAEWFFDGPNAQMRFWLDGAELAEIGVDGTGAGCDAQDAGYTWVAPAFSNISVGWKSYQVDDERSIWIDDVVIGSSKVGCPSPAL